MVTITGSNAIVSRFFKRLSIKQEIKLYSETHKNLVEEVKKKLFAPPAYLLRCVTILLLKGLQYFTLPPKFLF